jgi:membrane protein DedA with SNARE-associated domain
VRVYEAIFLATLSTVVLPLPEEATLLAAGYAARIGEVTLVGAIAAGLLAVLIGDVVSYFVGRLLLARVLRTRVGRWLVPERWRLWGESVVEGHAARAVVIGRFLVGLRGFVYFAVGASRYPFARFLAVDAAAGVVEVGGIVALGFAFGQLRASVGSQVDLAIAALLVATFFGPLVVRSLVRRRAA